MALQEIWRPSAIFPERYSVSSLGRVRSERTFGKGSRPGLILKPRFNRDGYVKAVLQRDRERRSVFVHRLVVETFVRALADGEEVDHLNGSKADNRLENLEPVSRLENIRRCCARGRNLARGSRSGTSRLNEKQVAEIRRMIASGARQAEAMRMFGVSRSLISQIANGKIWTHVPL